MTRQKILIPYNFTQYDKKALDFVIQTFANQEEVEITLFNSYIPTPEIEVRGSPIMDKMKGSLGYFSQKIKEQEDELKAVRGLLIEKGFPEDRIQTVFEPKKKDIAGDIVDLAQKGQFNVVVLNRKPGKIAKFFAGSVSNKVIAALKDKTVCIVS
jgi:hypothetical protein